MRRQRQLEPQRQQAPPQTSAPPPRDVNCAPLFGTRLLFGTREMEREQVFRLVWCQLVVEVLVGFCRMQEVSHGSSSICIYIVQNYRLESTSGLVGGLGSVCADGCVCIDGVESYKSQTYDGMHLHVRGSLTIVDGRALATSSCEYAAKCIASRIASHLLFRKILKSSSLVY